MDVTYSIGPKRSGVGVLTSVTINGIVWGKTYETLNDAADEAVTVGLISDAEFQRIFLEKSPSNGVSRLTPSTQGLQEAGFTILRK